MIVLISATFFILFLLVILSFVWPPESPWSPWWRTGKKTAKAVCALAKISKKDTVFELGSGDGEALITIARESGARCFGIEIDFARFFISWVRVIFIRVKNVKFILQDFKKTDLRGATVLYFYLVPAGIKRTLPKLEKELMQGTRLVSYKYKIPLPKKSKIILSKTDTKHELFLYKKM